MDKLTMYRFRLDCFNLINLVILCVVLFAQVDAGNCPTKCICMGKTVNCAFQGLFHIPRDIPKDTLKL